MKVNLKGTLINPSELYVFLVFMDPDNHYF
jgi:hypothetical protein